MVSGGWLVTSAQRLSAMYGDDVATFSLVESVQSNRAAHTEPLKQRSLWFPSSRRPGGLGRYVAG